MLSGKLAASGDFRAIREKLDERPYRVRIETGDHRAMAAALVRLDAVDSISIDPDGSLIVLSREVAVLQQSVGPDRPGAGVLRLMRVEPLDESLESVFAYVVER